jgi:hypothetical protein
VKINKIWYQIICQQVLSDITLPTSCCRYCLTTVACCTTLSNDEYAGRLACATINHKGRSIRSWEIKLMMARANHDIYSIPRTARFKLSATFCLWSGLSRWNIGDFSGSS